MNYCYSQINLCKEGAKKKSSNFSANWETEGTPPQHRGSRGRAEEVSKESVKEREKRREKRRGGERRRRRRYKRR